MKNTKITLLKFLEVDYVMQMIRSKNFKKKIPASKIKYKINDNGCVNFKKYNPFEFDDDIDVDDIKYVKINTNKHLCDKLNLKDYTYEGKHLKILKPNYKTELYESVGILVPIFIFKLVLTDMRYPETEHISLRTILNCCNNPLDIMLLDDNKHTIGFALLYQ